MPGTAFKFTLLLLSCALFACQLQGPSGLPVETPVSPHSNSHGNPPLYFEANRGQAPGVGKFISRGPGYTLFLEPSEVILNLHAVEHNRRAREIRMQLLGANDNAPMVGGTELPGRVNYLTGTDPDSWHRNIPTFEDVITKGVYPGIDLRYHGGDQRLEYDFIVSPGGDTGIIRLSFTGAESVRIDSSGDLLLETSTGVLRHGKPVIYQEINGVRTSVGGAYREIEDPETSPGGLDAIGIEIASYNPAHPLIIDPVLDYSTYLGGGHNDAGLAIAVDVNGNSYIAGATASLDFITDPSLQYGLAGRQDNFVAKLSADGQRLLYATYFGGSGPHHGYDEDGGEIEGSDNCEEFHDSSDVPEDENEQGAYWGMDWEQANSLAVNEAGEAIITGRTNSDMDFPLVNPVQAAYGGGCSDAYVVKLNADGSEIIYSTYLGGMKKDEGVAVAMDGEDGVIMAGNSSSRDYPVVNGMQDGLNGKQDAVITKLQFSSSEILFSTFLGGSRRDSVAAMVIEQDGGILLTGDTRSTDYPVTADALQQEPGGGYVIDDGDDEGSGRADAFLGRISADGQQLQYSTYLGGHGDDAGTGLAVDPRGRIIISGNTNSQWGFPVTGDALQMEFGGGHSDGFISIFDPVTGKLLYNSYFGGNEADHIAGVSVDGAGYIYLTGHTSSSKGFPLHDPLQSMSTEDDYDDANEDRPDDAFIANLTPGGDELIYSTWLGGSGMDRGTAVAADMAGNVHAAGITESADFPVHRPVQFMNNGYADAFVLKLNTLNHPPVVTSVPITAAPANMQYAYQVVAEDGDGDTLSYRLANAPDGMTIGEGSGMINWVQPQSGIHNIEIEVTDGRATAGQAYSLAINSPPSIISTPPLDAGINQTYLYNINATDVDGDELSYSLDIAPEGMTIQILSQIGRDGKASVSVYITWTTTERGDFDVVLRVTDSHGAYATQAFTINVPNTVPEILSLPVTFAIAGEPYTYQVLAQDGDGDVLTYSLIDSPAGMEMDPLTGLITWEAPVKGVSNVALEVNDGYDGTATQSYSIAVPNRAPVITSSPVTEVEFGEIYTYHVTAQDLDGDPLTYSLVNGPAVMTMDPATGVITWEPENGDDVLVEIRVEDDDQAGDTQFFKLIVRHPPVILSSPMTLGFQDQLYPYDVQAADPEDRPLYYALSQAPDGMGINPESGEITWRPGVSGDFPIEVTVTNNQGDRTTQAFTLKILAENDILIVSEPETEGFLGEPYRYTVSVLGQHTGSLIYTLPVAPIGMTISETGVIEWTPDSAGTFQVKVDVVNDQGGSDTQSYDIEVRTLEEMDYLFNQIWDRMFQELIAGNKDAALQLLTGAGQRKFGPVFDSLMPFMEEISANYTDLVRLSIHPDIAEYMTRRIGNDGTEIFFVTFIRNFDGDWKLHEM